MLIAVLTMAIAANAQFQKGKGYIGASMTGLDLSYNGNHKFHIGLEAKGGYILADNLMALASLGYEHSGREEARDRFSLAVGGRYYIIQNGLYLGVNAKWIHENGNYNDVMPGVEVGYAFFLNRSVTIEPAIYYDQSFRNHKDYSTIGLKVGVGVYLFDD